VGTTISTGGFLSVGLNESATTLTVKATSSADTTKSGTAAVTVTSGGDPVFTVTSVTVSPKTPAAEAGEELTFTATVVGTNNPAQTVTWTVYRSDGGALKIGTAFIGAKLTVAGDEPVGTLIVTATSTVDTTKSDTATLTVYAAGTKPTVTSV
jgi:hypothetical protein